LAVEEDRLMHPCLYLHLGLPGMNQQLFITFIEMHIPFCQIF